MTQWGLDTLFNPAKRHMDEEKRRLQSTREEVGDNSGGRRIDLESGKVVIRRDADDETAEATDEAAEATDETAEAIGETAGGPDSEAVEAEAAAVRPNETAAQRRARERRARARART